MGQAARVLSAPITTKDSGDAAAQSKGIAWGYSGMQGWRVNMEDAHFALPSLDSGSWADTAAFGVLDGHGGEQVAKFCERHLPREIACGSSKECCGALVRAFHRMDELLENPEVQDELRSYSSGSSGLMSVVGGPWQPVRVNPAWVGCTANVCLIRSNSIIVANAGDSRTVLCRNGQAVPLSEDHKPNLPVERDRIANAGGTVERQQVGPIVQYRVNGNLNLSRSIGDLEYKKNTALRREEQMICSTPDVSTFPRESGDEFLVMACDGVWDVVDCQDAVDFVRQRLQLGMRPLSLIMEELLDFCVSPDLAMTTGLGGDNMTAILIVFHPDTPLGQRNPGSISRELGLEGVSTNVVRDGGQIVEDGMIVPGKGFLCNNCLPATT